MGSMMMPFISSLFIKSFITQSACKSVHTSVFRFMILFGLDRLKQLTAVLARKTFTFMAPHM